MTKIKSLLNNKIFLYIILFLFSLFLASCCSDYDYDLYARFIVGENFFEKGVFNYQDFVSYTPTHPWFDHEYGASLIYYLFHKYLGAFGLVLIQAITLFLTGFFVIKTQSIQKHAYPLTLSLMSLFLILLAHQNPSIIRCHMCSFVFFAMFLYILEKTRIWNINKKQTKLIWIIPLLIVIWNNLHGGVVSGMGIIGIYMLGTFLSKQDWKKYFSVLIISIPLLAINPYGMSYFNFLISANTKERTMITEWWHVFVNRHVAYYYPLFITGVFGTLLVIINSIAKRKINITKFLVLIVTLYLGTIHVKLLSLPLITVFALYYNEIMHLLSPKRLRILEKFVLIAIFVSICFIPSKHPEMYKTDLNKFPVKEVEFIKINNIKGNILTEFGLGSYVSYKLYPDNLIYMDGRYEEVYNDKEFDKLMTFEQKKEGWESVLKDYPTDILLMEKTIPIYETMEKHKDWVKIYEGNLCGVFVKKKNAKKKYITPSDDIEYYRKNEFVNKGYFGKNEQ